MHKFKGGASKFSAIKEDLEDEEPAKIIAGGYPDLKLNATQEAYYISFDFIDASYKSGNFCFNNSKVSSFDYIKLFDFFKQYSGKTVSNITKDSDKFRIKRIDIKSLNNPNLVTELANCFGISIKELKQDPPYLFYQAHLYNSDVCIESNKKKAPRLYFIIGQRGTISLVLLDLYHEFFPTLDRSSTS